jgi:hypothetical protein
MRHTSIAKRPSDQLLLSLSTQMHPPVQSFYSAYGAYVQTNEQAVKQHYDWLPFSATDPPRMQGEGLYDMALDVNPANADAQVRLAVSFTERLQECPVEERESWASKAELHYQTSLVKDSQVKL